MLGSVGAPMAGTIIEVAVKPGMVVSPGQQLVVMSAMKMETAIGAPVGGTITQVRAQSCGIRVLHRDGNAAALPPTSMSVCTERPAYRTPSLFSFAAAMDKVAQLIRGESV